MRYTLPVALAAAALLAGCGGDDGNDDGTKAAAPPAAAATATSTIRIADFLYEPDPVTVRAGRKITIVNSDSAPHTITEEGTSPSFDSDTIAGGKRGSVTFTTPGTFKYLCVFHPTMKGTVTVMR